MDPVSTISLVSAALTLSVISFARNSLARRRNSWPVARGTIASTDVLAVAAHFAAVVRYRYALTAISAYRGTEHVMEGKLESPPYRTRREAEAFLERYPVGDRIDVRYDPARPTRSAACR